MLFVTHNLPFVRSIAQRVAVKSWGRMVDLADVERPPETYTKRVLSDAPALRWRWKQQSQDVSGEPSWERLRVDPVLKGMGRSQDSGVVVQTAHEHHFDRQAR